MLSFFFYDPAPTEIYTLSLHDALPILWNPEPFTAGTDAGRIFRIEERAACDRAEEQADAVNRLREIDPRRRVLRRTEHGGVRVRDRFEKRETRRDDANAQQESPELRDVRCGNKPEPARRDHE